MDLTRISLEPVEVDVTAALPDGSPTTIDAVQFALLPPRRGPSAATIWSDPESFTYPMALLSVAGLDVAPAAGRFIVPAGGADLWMLAADGTDYIKPVLIERISMLDGGPAGDLPISTVSDSYVAGLVTGATGTQAALDARYVNEGQGAGGALSGTYPSPGLNETTVDSIVAGKIPGPSSTATALNAAVGAAVKSPAPAGSTATFAYFPNTLSNGTDTGGNSLLTMKAPVVIRRIRVTEGNIQNAAGVEADGPNTYTARHAIEYPAATFTPVYWNGVRDGTFDPGGIRDSDWAEVNIPAGATYWIRTFWTVASGAKVPIGGLGTGTSGTAQTDQTTTGTIGTGGGVHAPVRAQIDAISGTTRRIFVDGDSRTLGSGDAPSTSGGWVTRAFDNAVLYQRFGLSSAKMQNAVIQSTHRRAQALSNGCNVGINAYGINDVVGARTLVQMQTDSATWANDAIARGMKPWLTTLPPNTTSTDGWATTTNQTPVASEASRVAFNNWVRTTPSPYVGYLELADPVETARNSGIWQASGRAVNDAAATSGSAIITSATANFTAADVGKIIRINGAGPAGAALDAFVLSVQSTTQMTMQSKTASTTVTGALMGINIQTFTQDGLHPSAGGYIAMAVVAAAAIPSLTP